MAGHTKIFSSFARPLLNRFTHTPLQQVIFRSIREIEYKLAETTNLNISLF